MDSVSPRHLVPPESQRLQPVVILRVYFLIALLVTVVGIISAVMASYGRGSIWGFSGSTLLGLWPLYGYAFLLLAGIYFLRRHKSDWMVMLSRSVVRAFTRLGFVNWVLFIMLIALYGWYLLADLDPLGFDATLQVFVFGHLGLLGVLLLIGTGKIKPIKAIIASFSLYGLFIWALYWIPDVQTYPLSMGWSETTWFYDASLFFSQRIYGFRAPLSSLHPSRYLLQAVLFLFPGLPLWAHRLWQVLLWLGLSLAGGLALQRRIHPGDRWLGLGIVAWFTLFCFQGPVYYHLMVVILIVLLGFNKDRLGLSFVYMLVASLWGGISRVNWFPVAGMLTAMLYILEKPQNEKPFWQYWRWPVANSLLGLVVGFSAQAIYVFLSGRRLEDFASSFRSPLLSYRLFPNEAFGMGILLMLLIASLPPIILLLWLLLQKLWMWRPLRLLGVLSILLALLISGLVVSSKIGGGNNLHNLDAFLVFLAVVAMYVMFNRFYADEPQRFTPIKTPTFLILLMAFIPTLFVLNNLRPYATWDDDRAWGDIEQVQGLIDQWVTEDGEVLFIQDRHLLTFGIIDGLMLVPEYEKVFLMEMAMSENEQYLDYFQRDIATRRYDLIVIEPLFFEIKPSTEEFSEENNLWIKYVNRPLDQTYQVVFESEVSELSVLVPRPTQ
jgi:hypothetical protein